MGRFEVGGGRGGGVGNEGGGSNRLDRINISLVKNTIRGVLGLGDVAGGGAGGGGRIVCITKNENALQL